MGAADQFLEQVEETVNSVLKDQQHSTITNLPPDQRQAVGVARHLHRRLSNLRRNHDCPTCWMQQAHCICDTCSSQYRTIPNALGIHRIFLLVHHKEIGLKVDTMKLLLAAFPDTCRLVVAGIGPEYQPSMNELEQVLHSDNNNCLVLFPDEQAMTVSEWLLQKDASSRTSSSSNEEGGGLSHNNHNFNLIVLDGTWAQANKLFRKYIAQQEHVQTVQTVQTVQLSDASLEQLDGQGHQLRRHSTVWRQIGTFEATRLFLQELADAARIRNGKEYEDITAPLEQLRAYQEIANDAARRELGPPRVVSG